MQYDYNYNYTSGGMITTNNTGSIYFNRPILQDIIEQERQDKKIREQIALEKRQRDSIRRQQRREQQRLDAKYAGRRK